MLESGRGVCAIDEHGRGLMPLAVPPGLDEPVALALFAGGSGAPPSWRREGHSLTAREEGRCAEVLFLDDSRLPFAGVAAGEVTLRTPKSGDLHFVLIETADAPLLTVSSW